MIYSKKYLKAVCVLLLAALMLSGCSSNHTFENFKDYVTPIEALSIPEDTVIVGLGEATHGNKEFVQIKQEVFEHLVKKDGFNVFALEGDFGGSQVVNEYVLHGNGTAQNAVNEIGFAIYKTQEMVDLVEWIRHYNVSAPEDSRIRFYGFDMQRYDNNKRGLFAYLKKVDNEKAAIYEEKIAALNDETVFDQSKDNILSGLTEIENIMKEMQQNKEHYLKQSTEAEYSMAYEYANSIQQNAILRGKAKNYSQTRDEFMAEKVSWILSYEEKLGNNKLFIAGHNGHIEKSSASPFYKSMGSILNEKFKDQYYAIGTEFYESTFSAKDSQTGDRKEFYLKNENTSELIRIFKDLDIQTGFLDFDQSMKDPDLKSLLESAHKMSNIGDEFSEFHKKTTKLYTLKMVPTEAYNGLIFVRKATPTTKLLLKNT